MTIDAQMLAMILLILRVIAVGLLVAVLWRQIVNIRTFRTDYPMVRYAIFAATIVLLFGQFIPILLDAVVAFGSTYQGRDNAPDALPVAYALNNAGKDVVIGALLAFIHYRTGANRQ